MDDPLKYPNVIGEQVNGIIESATRAERRALDCVNWGAVSAESVRIKAVVVVTEASPHADDFREWVKEKLKSRGWNVDNVEIITEW